MPNDEMQKASSKEVKENNPMSLAEKIYFDEEARKIKQEELILFMGSPIYKHICNKMLMRSRTLLDSKDVRDLLIKNDSVTMQLKEDCKNPACNA